MKAFNLFIEDDRYSVPTVKLAVAETESRALAIATQQLAASPHHLAVEICYGEKLLATLRQGPGPSGDIGLADAGQSA